MKTLFSLILLFIGLISCNQSSQYEELLQDYENDLQMNRKFSYLVDEYFYQPDELKKDTSYGSFYFINKLASNFHKILLTNGNKNIEYYWGNEIQGKDLIFSESNCDCNLLIENKEYVGYVAICFYKGKIYSLNPESMRR